MLGSGLEGAKMSRGELLVITGPMGSGKTLELVREIRRRENFQDFFIFKSRVDTRDDEFTVKSRCGVTLPAISVGSVDEMMEALHYVVGMPDIICFDEIQFFDHEFIEFIEWLLESETDVICTGLNTDFRGEPFGIMPYILAKADDIRFLCGVCVVCGGPATKTQRLAEGNPWDDDLIVIGGDKIYECRCPKHWEKPRKEE